MGQQGTGNAAREGKKPARQEWTTSKAWCRSEEAALAELDNDPLNAVYDGGVQGMIADAEAAVVEIGEALDEVRQEFEDAVTEINDEIQEK